MLFGKGPQPMRPKEVRVVEVAQGVSLGYVAMDPDGVVEFSGTRFGVPEPRQKRPARLFSTLPAEVSHLFHNYALPAVLVAFAIVMVEATPLALGLIWAAHIGMDRMIGFGLKYPTGFRHTHLDRL